MRRLALLTATVIAVMAASTATALADPYYELDGFDNMPEALPVEVRDADTEELCPPLTPWETDLGGCEVRLHADPSDPFNIGPSVHYDCEVSFTLHVDENGAGLVDERSKANDEMCDVHGFGGATWDAQFQATATGGVEYLMVPSFLIGWPTIEAIYGLRAEVTDGTNGGYLTFRNLDRDPTPTMGEGTWESWYQDELLITPVS